MKRINCDLLRRQNVQRNFENFDSEIFNAINKELKRQQDNVELIASENIVSKAVLEAQGSVLTNKYAEGYPGRRYYGGCEYVDEIEQLAIDRLKLLFGAQYANVQPIRVHRQIWLFSALCLNPATRCWA